MSAYLSVRRTSPSSLTFMWKWNWRKTLAIILISIYFFLFHSDVFRGYGVIWHIALFWCQYRTMENNIKWSENGTDDVRTTYVEIYAYRVWFEIEIIDVQRSKSMAFITDKWNIVYAIELMIKLSWMLTQIEDFRLIWVLFQCGEASYTNTICNGI